MAHEPSRCPMCGCATWLFEGGWFRCQNCGELEPAKDEVVYVDDPRLTGDDDGGKAA